MFYIFFTLNHIVTYVFLVSFLFFILSLQNKIKCAQNICYVRYMYKYICICIYYMQMKYIECYMHFCGFSTLVSNQTWHYTLFSICKKKKQHSHYAFALRRKIICICWYIHATKLCKKCMEWKFLIYILCFWLLLLLVGVCCVYVFFSVMCLIIQIKKI